MKMLLLEGEAFADGGFQMYEGLGFPTTEQFSCSGFPSLTVIESGGGAPSRCGLSVC